jgi:uncharacterized protein (DUF58 family)
MNWRGTVYLVLSFAVGFAAAVKGNNLLFIIFSTLLGVFVASVVLTLLGPRAIEFSRLLPEAAFAYTPFAYGLRIRIRKRLLPAFGIRIDDRLTHDGRLSAVQPVPIWIPFALPGEKLRATTTAADTLRGPAKFGPLTITSEFPPGLVTYSVTLALEDTVLVYPRQGAIQRRILNPYLSRLEHRDLVATLNASGDEEFAGLRDYRDGDNPRRIHWKLLGRLPGQVIVREYEDARVRQAVILLDTFLPNATDRKRRSRLERAVSFTAALADALLAENYVLTFRAFAPEPVELALEPRLGMLEELNIALAQLKPSRIHTVDELLPAESPPGEEVYFVLAIGDGPGLDLPRHRSMVIPADEMRTLMYYPS